GPDAALGRPYQLWPGHPPPPLNRRHHCRRLTRRVRAAADPNLDVERELSSKNCRSDQTVLASDCQGAIDPFDGDLMLAADIDIPLVGPNRVRVDQVALDNRY